MATNNNKITEELVAPTIPVTNNNAVKTAANGLQTAKNAVANMTYDKFKGGSLYQGLQRDFQQQGQRAMKDTLGQVAARTGGMASSYATTAANQSYNNYMQTLEDAARSMYNDEYSRAQDRYDMALREYENAYGEYRDSVGDAWNSYSAKYDAYRDSVEDRRYKTEWDYKTGQDAKAAEEERIYMDIYYGGTSDYNTYEGAGGKLSQAEYESIVRSAQGARSDDTYSRDQAAKEQAQADVMAIWASGGTPTPEQLEAAGWYNDTIVANDATDMTADNDGDGYPDNLSELGRAYYNQTKIDNYTYQNTEQGRTGILNTLANSANATLSTTDQANFDYLFDEGAYDAVQKMLLYASNIRADDQGASRDFDALYEDLATRFPEFSNNQILTLLELANPDAFALWGE